MPASNERALEKARTLAADALILDLEDAVAPDAKVEAREKLAALLQSSPYGARTVLVRTNGLDTEWGRDDIAAFAGSTADALLIPKVGSAADIHEVEALMEKSGYAETTRIWAMMESPIGILNADEIAGSSPRLEGFVLGTNDLVKDLRAIPTANRDSMVYALSRTVHAARAFGLVCVDGVYNAIHDENGLRAECEHGKILGMDGKSLIHPKQLAPTNDIFAPSEEELDTARAVVAAFDEAIADGKAVALLNGRIVENLHADAARLTLAQAEAIKKLEGAA